MSERTPQNKKDQLKTEIETSMSDIKTKKTNKEQQCPQLNKIIVTIGPELSHSIVANYSTCVGPATYLQAMRAACATAKSLLLPTPARTIAKQLN